jgi:hypothetical protein
VPAPSAEQSFPWVALLPDVVPVSVAPAWANVGAAAISANPAPVERRNFRINGSI